MMQSGPPTTFMKWRIIRSDYDFMLFLFFLDGYNHCIGKSRSQLYNVWIVYAFIHLSSKLKIFYVWFLSIPKLKLRYSSVCTLEKFRTKTVIKRFLHMESNRKTMTEDQNFSSNTANLIEVIQHVNLLQKNYDEQISIILGRRNLHTKCWFSILMRL